MHEPKSTEDELAFLSRPKLDDSPEKLLTDIEDELHHHNLAVRTHITGLNMGRVYLLRFPSRQMNQEWMAMIKKNQWIAERKLDREKSMGELFKKYLTRVYEHWIIQGFFGFTILANFAVNIAETCLPESVLARKNVKFGLLMSDYVFTGIFSFELLLNMTCNFFVPFWKDGWNIFDFLVVAISVFALINIPIPPELSVLRSLRVFRAARLFRKWRETRVIMNAIIGSLQPVAISIFIFFLVTAMFAVIGKNLYDKNHPESFRDFAHAMFTMYQVATGDSWASGVARPIIFQNDLTSKKFSIDGVAMV